MGIQALSVLKFVINFNFSSFGIRVLLLAHLATYGSNPDWINSFAEQTLAVFFFFSALSPKRLAKIAKFLLSH